MTLNITILTPRMIFQSADYRLSSSNQPLASPSTKVLEVSYKSWAGSITYTGVGSIIQTGGIGTTEFSTILTSWLKAINHSTSFDDVVETIRRKAAVWFKIFNPPELHTIIIVAFSDGRPCAALISNFEDLNGKMIYPNTSFRAYKTKRIFKPFVILTGYTRSNKSPSFNREVRATKIYLTRMAEYHENDPTFVRRAIAKANRKIARLQRIFISEDCLVYSQDQNGHGYTETFGESRSVPKKIMGGQDLESLINPFLKKVFGPNGWSVRAGTSSRSGVNSHKPTQCSAISKDGHLRSTENPIILASIEGSRATPFAANSAQIVVGRAQKQLRGLDFPCVWHEPNRLEFLTYNEGIAGVAWDINEAGTIVGSTDRKINRRVACIWKSSTERLDIGTELSSNSEATKINIHGGVVGWASIHPTESGQLQQRPAIWPANGSPTILTDVPYDWGVAVDINAEDHVLIRTHIGIGRNCAAFIWDGKNFINLGAPDSKTAAIYPKRLLDDGSVIALCISTDQIRSGHIWTERDGWRSLFSPKSGREFICTNDQVVIAGYDVIDDYQIAWIKRPKEDLIHLDSILLHHNKPNFISNTGYVFGIATADYCSHPLRWNLNAVSAK